MKMKMILETKAIPVGIAVEQDVTTTADVLKLIGKAERAIRDAQKVIPSQKDSKVTAFKIAKA